jgi:hypothetical protein
MQLLLGKVRGDMLLLLLRVEGWGVLLRVGVHVLLDGLLLL